MYPALCLDYHDYCTRILIEECKNIHGYHQSSFRVMLIRQCQCPAVSVNEKNVGGGQFFSGLILGPNGMGNSLIAGKFREKVFVTHPNVDAQSPHWSRVYVIFIHLPVPCLSEGHDGDT